MSTAATAASGVGHYAITVGLGALAANNYSFTFVNGNLSVTPATLTVTADDKTKIYGSTNPPLADSITGFVNGDTASVVAGAPALGTTATAASGVGNYAINVTQGTLSAANYTFAFANGTLSVTPATLTVTADDKTKVYGSANPPLTDTISGFVNGDTASVVSGAASLSTSATAASGVGNYVIIAASGTLSAEDYVFKFVNGVLTVGAASSGEGGIVATAVPVVGYELSPLTAVTVATFTDGDGSLPAADFNATIDWGDGTTSAGSVTVSAGGAGATTTPQYTVSGTHTYGDEGHYMVQVAMAQSAGVPTSGATSATVSATATIHEALLAEGTVGTPEQNYIQEIYRDLFGRQAEPRRRP